MFDRDGLRDLVAAAKRKEFDAIIIEDTDRLSRNQADLAWLFEHLQFRDVKLVTVAKGEVTEMQIAFDGIRNPDYVKKLAARVKRGHDGIAREGKIAGGVCMARTLFRASRASARSTKSKPPLCSESSPSTPAA
jgi:site-specific DNA recombinase